MVLVLVEMKFYVEYGELLSGELLSEEPFSEEPLSEEPILLHGVRVT